MHRVLQREAQMRRKLCITLPPGSGTPVNPWCCGVCGVDICHRAKTQRPVQFEVTDQTRVAHDRWISKRACRPEDFLFPSRVKLAAHLSTELGGIARYS